MIGGDAFFYTHKCCAHVAMTANPSAAVLRREHSARRGGAAAWSIAREKRGTAACFCSAAVHASVMAMVVGGIEGRERPL